jgi:alkaline phosphatase D
MNRIMKRSIWFLLLISMVIGVSLNNASAQQEPLLISGPMLGYSEHRSVLVWYEVSQSVKTAMLRYWEKDNTDYFYEMDYSAELGKPYNPIKFELVKLKLNTSYNFEILLNGKVIPASRMNGFTTKPHQANPEADPYNFSFLAGSCMYFNDPILDAQSDPYGQDTYILRTMASMASSFNLWLGDNVYLRASDYGSSAGIIYRYSLQRKAQELSDILASRPNYAIWDDHDYGGDNFDRSFELKSSSQEIFKSYWGNKSYGTEKDAGIFSSFSWSDGDFFLMDDRSHRAPNQLRDSIGGKPNCEKEFFGVEQLSWLKDKLLGSTATFKFIAVGNQVLNQSGGTEYMRNYSCEFTELMNFIVTYKIEGVVFLSGDRHFSEVITYQPKGGYKMYDFTCSALTSRPRTLNEKEKTNPNRVPQTLVTNNTFARFEISGPKGDRSLKMVTIDKSGVIQSSFLLNEKDLKMK